MTKPSRLIRLVAPALALLLLTTGAQAAPLAKDACALPERVAVDAPFAFELPAEKLPPRLDYGLLYYRNLMNSSWKTSFLKARPDGKSYQAVIPGQQVSKPGLEVYVVAYDKRGKETVVCFSSADPGLLRVDNVASSAPIAAAALVQGTEPEAVKAPAATPPEGAPVALAPVPFGEEAAPVSEAPLAAKTLTSGSVAATPTEESLAEEFALFTHETEAKVLSASKGEIDISRSPSTITVITADDIRNYGSSSIVDVLRTVPGMDFIEISHTDKELNVRGFNREGANKLLVLIDGRSVSIDLLGVTFWEALPISVEDVERIEVIRGPASALYGNNAFSGVVSIYTKHPEDIKGAIYRVQAGPYNTTVSGTVGARREHDGYKLSANYKRLSSFDNAGVNDLEGLSAAGEYEYVFSKKYNFTLRGGLEKDTVNKVFTLVGPIGTNVVQGYAQASALLEDFTLKAGWSMQRGDLDVNIPLPNFVVSDPAYYALPVGERDQKVLTVTNTVPETPDMRFSSHTIDSDLIYSREFGKIYRLSLGTSFRAILFNGHNLGADNNKRYQFSLSNQNELYPVKWFATTVSYRYDLAADKAGDSATKVWHNHSPRGALIFIPNKDHTVRVSGGLAFRTPAYFESDMKISLNNITMTTSTEKLAPVSLGGTSMAAPAMTPFNAAINFSGNPKLKPEKLYTMELSYAGRFLNRIELNIDTFFNWYRDLILFQGDPEKLYWMLNPFYQPEKGFTPFGFNNNVSANNAGVEVALSARMTSWLKGFANGSFQFTWVTNEKSLKEKYARDKNAFYETIPTSYTVLKNYELLGYNYEVINSIFPNGKPFHVDAKKVKLREITTVDKENPRYKFNLGLNTQYKGLRANLFATIVAPTERSTFLTRLGNATFCTFAYNPKSKIETNSGGNPKTITGSWFYYTGQGPAAIYTKTPTSGTTSTTTLMTTEKIPLQYLMNMNVSYGFWEGRLEIGMAAFDLLHLPSLWQSTRNQGFKVKEVKDPATGVTYLKATGIANPRYAQYPRQLLFGKVMGGETIPTRVDFFIRGQI